MEPVLTTTLLVQWERVEMCTMSQASEISTNVWQGPTPDHLLRAGPCELAQDEGFDLFIDTNDLAGIPEPRVLETLEKKLQNGPQRLEFPSSGSAMPPSSLSDEKTESDSLVNTMRWLYSMANPGESVDETDPEGDMVMASPVRRPCKIFIHCPDGYTESSLLALAYTMFAEGLPANQAWLKLHCDKKRNFFAYPIDVSYLSSMQERLLQASPVTQTRVASTLSEHSWFNNCDGSFPSRILPYMYLGSLAHANNPEMLWELGIRRVLSIGESVVWPKSAKDKFGLENVIHITQVQDNGIDPLTKEFGRCLEFIGEFFSLVHLFLDDVFLTIIQNKESMMVQLLWFTVVLVFLGQRPSALPK